jgi:hypothetical protein
VGEPKANELREYVRWRYAESQPGRWKDSPKKEAALALESLGAKILKHRDSRSFGSWYLIFQFRRHILRLVFDAKESVYELGRKSDPSPPDEWEPVRFVRAQADDKLVVYDEHRREPGGWSRMQAKTASSLPGWLIAAVREVTEK